MKIVKLIAGALIIYIIILSFSIPLQSCTKKVLIHDTTIITDHDTTTVTEHDTSIITVHDTTYVRDSIYEIHDGLIAFYNFKNGSLTDSSIYGNDITFNNAVPATDRFGNPNGAFTFNGVDNYMSVPNSYSLNPRNITIMAVFKVSGFNAGSCHANQIVGKGYPDFINGFYYLRYEDPGPCNATIDSAHEFFLGGFGDNNPQGTAAVAAPDSIAVQKDQWYNVIYTFDGIASKVFVNGILKDKRLKTVIFTDNTHDLFIGKHEDPLYPYWFNGTIDEIRIYNRALPMGAVKALNNLTE